MASLRSTSVSHTEKFDTTNSIGIFHFLSVQGYMEGKVPGSVPEIFSKAVRD